MRGLRLINYLLLLIYVCAFCLCDRVNKSVDDGRGDEEHGEESLDIATENEGNETMPCSRRQASEVHEIRTAKAGQFPFMAAIMSHYGDYLCGGTVVSDGMILTTGQCLSKPINHVLLNTIKDKKDNTTFKAHIYKSELFPTYDANNPSSDLGLLYTEKYNDSIKRIDISDVPSTEKIVELTLIGYGLNADVGKSKDLQYTTVRVDTGMYAKPSDNLMQTYLDCIDTRVPTCFRDFGGPAMIDDKLVGIAVKGEKNCRKEMTSDYKIYQPMASVVPIVAFRSWLYDKVARNDKSRKVGTLHVYPADGGDVSGRKSMSHGSPKHLSSFKTHTPKPKEVVRSEPEENSSAPSMKNNMFLYCVLSFTMFHLFNF